MLKIQLHNKYIRNFTGIICINVENTTKYLRKIFEYESQGKKAFNINGIDVGIKEFTIISPLTTLDTLYNFNTKGTLNKIINEYDLNIEKLINKNYLQNVANKINKRIGWELININESPVKIFKSMYEVEGNKFIDDDLLHNFFQNAQQNEKQNIILKDFDDISVAKLLQFSNNFNIIILTNNAFNLVKSPSEVTLINFVGSDWISLENLEAENIFEYFIEEYFQKPFDCIGEDAIYTKDVMENMKKSLFLK
ncbi:hypothetical protein RRG44_01405 [Mycoplasmopsis cynos]|uniref:hypothetical protein n=1 Tax=Mycoplasmopsis cynos TaxID=171284 RepID=UPI002AFF1376|nr:hypothetical protein [Mycoplasmopsis cynos]WQQ19469.1 hypothetical protein RRG44_01405 [Mycoplasmopsis cynos]